MTNQQYSGKRAEYLVLTELLKLRVEAYPAISFLQEDYDITAILSSGNVKRIQVKSTELQNNSKNNNIKFRKQLNFDFLALVVFDNDSVKHYILSKTELDNFLNNSNLSISQKNKDKYVVLNKFDEYSERWEKIK